LAMVVSTCCRWGRRDWLLRSSGCLLRLLHCLSVLTFSFDTQDCVYDVAWNEVHEYVL
jgi:hypothetical protein